MDYQSSGVDIEAGNRAVDRIRSLAKATQTANVLGDLGHFGAFYELPADVENPVLVSCTDGVGTKLKLAFELGRFDTVGVDLVAMCVNDLICSGAKPLFFLDYYACQKLQEEQVEQVLVGMANACQQTGLSLVGGEMAEMGDVYAKGEFDLAGFCVGVVSKNKIIDGSKIAEGQTVYGLASSGAHSNGFSLLRQVLTPEVCAQRRIDRQTLLEPTKLYVNDIQVAIANYTVTGICHITGGGLCENISRILPKNVSVLIKKNALPKHEIFEHIQLAGQVSQEEMFRVFNMGVGMVITSPDKIDHPDFIEIGNVISGNGTTELI